MRVAIFAETFLPKWDGVANTLCYLLEHLQARGHTCLMFAPAGAPPVYAGTRIIGLPSVEFPLYRELRVVPPLVNVSQALAEFGPDVVHLVNPASLGLAGMREARELGVPVVASYHTDMPGHARFYGVGMLEQIIWAYFRWLHNQADLTLCPSRYTQAQLGAHGFERVAVWGRGVDTVKFNPRHRSREWRMRLTGGEPQRPLLLYVGRLAIEKRIDQIRPLLDILPGVSLGIVGDGPLRRDLEKTFAGTATVFTGYLEGMDLAHAYASADLFVFPSANETFGNVVLEAMASGLPVVAVGAGGPADHVLNGSNGYLSDPNDPADFVALAWRCITDEGHRQAMGCAATQYASTQTWTAVLDSLIVRYEELAKSVTRPVIRPPFGSWWRVQDYRRNVANRF